MASTRVLASSKFNLLKRGTTSISTGTADANYPVTNLYDGEPSTPLLVTAAGNVTLDVDGDLLKQVGDMEGTFSVGVAAGFTDRSTGDGTPAQEGTLVHAGAKAQKLSTAAAGVARVSIDLDVLAGEVLSLSAWLRGDGTATISAQLQDLATNKFWNGSIWSSSSAVTWAGRSTASYAESTSTVTVDTADNIRAATTTLRLSFYVSSAVAAGAGYVDDVAVWPSVDCVSLHGHNIPVGAQVDLLSSTSSGWGSPTTEADDIPVYQPAFYSLLAAAVAKRYWRVRITDSIAREPIYIGELVIGAAVTLTASPNYPLPVAEAYRHQRAQTALGRRYVLQRVTQPARVATLDYEGLSAAQGRELRRLVYLASVGDLYPCVVIPQDDDAERVYHGRLATDEHEEQTEFLTYRRVRLVVSEQPFPVLSL